jgi:signal recognition particle receptor subunit beta
MSKAALVVTIAFVAIISVGGTTVYAQVAQGSNVVIEPEASADSVSFKKLNERVESFVLDHGDGIER